jgi:hypothetical protein
MRVCPPAEHHSQFMSLICELLVSTFSSQLKTVIRGIFRIWGKTIFYHSVIEGGGDIVAPTLQPGTHPLRLPSLWPLNVTFFVRSLEHSGSGSSVGFLILSKFYLPTDAQLNCLKSYFKIDIKIDIKTAPTCFGLITIIRERTIRSC